MQPYDYRSMVQDPFESALQGVKFGASLAELQAARQQRELLAQQQQQQLEQQRLQAEQFNQARTAFFNNPNPTIRDASTFLSFLSKDQQAAFEPYVKQISEAENKASLNFGLQVMSALERKPEYAAELLEQRAEAEQNPQNAQFYKQLAARTRENPADAIKVGTLLLAPIPGAKEALANMATGAEEARKAEKAPFELIETEAKAKTAAVKAKFAESDAALDLQKKGWDITKIQKDIEIAKQNANIAAANAQIARESNNLKKQELQLKVEEMISKRDSDVRTKTASAESSRSTIDNALSTVERLLANPAWKDVVGSIEGRVPGIVGSIFDENESNALALIDTLGSQSFMAAVANVGSMAGLTEKEGEKLQNSIASFSRSQGEKQFEENAKEFQRIMLKARKNLSIKYGVPDTKPDVPSQSSPAKTVSEGPEGVSKSGRPMVFRNGGWVYK